ncbi:MAG: SDR family oxidoreductase [Candidatus Omnitrophica bacterium]|nr:SDR family oxidoreductase [Candidatus Omnitrophota bacterium]
MSLKSASTALVTGASFGIGLEMARELAARGHNLVLAARNIEKLREVSRELSSASIRVEILQTDLSQSGAARALYDELKRRGIKIDILINNAGSGIHGHFTDMDWQAVSAMLRLNIESLTELTHLFLRDFLEARAGRILNVASTAAFQPGPLMACYYASKAFVLSFSEALCEELRDSAVTVTALCPGPTHSEFQKRAGMGHVELFTRFSMKTRQVARDGVQAMLKGKRLVVSGWLNNLLVFLIRFSPRFLTPKLVYSFQSGRLASSQKK